jgi:hypothetical protein
VLGLNAKVKLVDLNGCGGVRGKVNRKTQVQKPNLGHPQSILPSTRPRTAFSGESKPFDYQFLRQQPESSSIVYLGIEVLANPESPAFKSFSAAAFAIGGTNFVNALIFRYSKGFREERSPYRRESLRKSIAELKEIRAKWGQ